MMISVRAMMVALNLGICKKGDYQIFAYQDNPSVASGTDEGVLVQVNASEIIRSSYWIPFTLLTNTDEINCHYFLIFFHFL